MRSDLPRMTITPPKSGGLHPKFGGLPWGLPPERWPLCRCCGEPMSAMVQIPVRGSLDRVDWIAARADMADRVLHLFTCERPSESRAPCPFWELEDGANAAFFLREGELGDTVSALPSPEPEILPEVWILEWEPLDDAVSPEMAEAFLDNRYWSLPDDLSNPHGFGSKFQTKIGGVPYWTGNGPQKIPDPPFRYVFQIDILLNVVENDRVIELANFCSDGTGYLYVDATGPEPRALFAINR